MLKVFKAVLWVRLGSVLAELWADGWLVLKRLSGC